jgi:DNA (cytosine-5)-methyltransferase 1
MKDPGTKLKVGSDFSGVGAFNQALIRLGVNYEEIFACDRDKYARQTFVHNYGEPKYYPTDVYERKIPAESLDVYMTSPPCQAFSLAGKRLGKEDKRGILFFNSLEFIKQNKPRFFIFENVKGLLSDDSGKTFQEWVNLLGGKSVNGLPVLFADEESVEYHLYWKVLNAKEHGVPQNRERVFLVGIRDDADNNFRFPKEEHLTKKLKDILELEVDNKYFISDKKINYLLRTEGTTFDINAKILEKDFPNESRTIQSGYWKGGRDCQFLKVKSNNSKGYEIAEHGDSIRLAHPNSETSRGRIGKEVSHTLDAGSNEGVILKKYQKEIEKSIKQDVCTTIDASYYKGFGIRQGNCLQVVNDNFRIRRLTPRECFRLMDFPDTFDFSVVSNSQAYRQAGNSIVVNVLYKILKNLNL